MARLLKETAKGKPSPMASETRLQRRTGSANWYLIAWVPEDVRHLIPGGRGGTKWISLRTADHGEAKRRVRIASVQFDQQVAAARRSLAGQEDRIDQAEAERIARLWESRELAHDEDVRRLGVPEEVFAEDERNTAGLSRDARMAVARGRMPQGDFRFDTILPSLGIHLNVSPGSESWSRLNYEFIKAAARMADALASRNQGQLVETPAPPRAADTARVVTVEQLIQAYLANPAKKRSAGTLKTYNTVFNAMRELLGPDTPVDSIHPVDCERIRSVLLRLPVNAKQRFRGMTLSEAADAADARKQLKRLGVKAVNNYLHNLSALFKWGVKTWRVTRNPAEGLAIADSREAKDGRQPFSTDQLRAIFNAPLYTGCVNDEEGFAKPGPNVPRRARFWVPLLSLWTGMRLGECCQLHVQDVTELDGVPVILVNETNEPGADEADRKRLKTDAGERIVPIHPELQRIGFLQFVEEMRARGERRLFPELKPDRMGYLSGPFSKFFNDRRRFLGKLGMAGTGVSFHSFRHSYRDALREAEISLERVRALGGWSRDSGGEEANYGKGLKPSTLYREIQKIDYPGLDLSHLYVAEADQLAA